MASFADPRMKFTLGSKATVTDFQFTIQMISSYDNSTDIM